MQYCAIGLELFHFHSFQPLYYSMQLTQCLSHGHKRLNNLDANCNSRIAV